MTHSLPIRRNLPLYMVALTLLLLMLAPTLFALTPTHHVDSCACCTHSQPSQNAACCTRSHAPVALPTTPAITHTSALTISTYLAPIATSSITFAYSALQQKTRPAASPTPLRI